MTEERPPADTPHGVRAREAGTVLADEEGRLHLSAPADPEILELVHAMLTHLWHMHAEVSERDRGRFETALIEILANVVEHAYEHDPETGRRFHIAFGVCGDQIVAHLSDNGLPMSLDMSDVAMPDEMAESGRGLAIAHATLDDLSYERVEGRNHWTLLCVLGSS